jgi:hypothetical protein
MADAAAVEFLLNFLSLQMFGEWLDDGRAGPLPLPGPPAYTVSADSIMGESTGRPRERSRGRIHFWTTPRGSCSMLTHVVLLAAVLVGDTPPEKFDAGTERAKLEGVWQTARDAKPAVRLEIKGRGLALAADGPTLNLLMSHLDGEAFDVAEVGGRRAIRLQGLLAKLSTSPGDIGYKFDKDVLVLTFEKGDLKGEHRLTKATKPK